VAAKQKLCQVNQTQIDLGTVAGAIWHQQEIDFVCRRTITYSAIPCENPQSRVLWKCCNKNTPEIQRKCFFDLTAKR